MPLRENLGSGLVARRPSANREAQTLGTRIQGEVPARGYGVHSTEKTLLCENYKPLMIRPNRFMGTRCTLSFAYSNTRLFFARLVTDNYELFVAMKTVPVNLKVTNNAPFEHFTVQNLP